MRFSIGVAAIGLTLAACSSSDSNAPGNAAPLTQADAQVIGDEMQSELAGMSDGAIRPGPDVLPLRVLPGSHPVLPWPDSLRPPAGRLPDPGPESRRRTRMAMVSRTS